MQCMERRSFLQALSAAGILHTATTLGLGQTAEAEESSSAAVYELRVYHAAEGKLEDLLARFRDHTVALFNKHSMRSVAYWTPLDDPLKGKTLFYILAHPSRAAAAANWKAFGEDPEWVSVKRASETNGPLTEKIESTFIALTDFSPRV